MICVSGAGSELPSWAAFVAGMTGGLFFFLVSGLLRLNKVDDPVHGVGVQLSGGVVGENITDIKCVSLKYDTSDNPLTGALC